MADSSYVQSSFLGGRWSPNAQGRIDLPDYSRALAESENGLSLEEGSWTRRPGTHFEGGTYNHQDGVIREFWLPGNQIVVMEFTPGRLRFWVPADTFGTEVGYSLLVTEWVTPFNTLEACQSIRVVQDDDVAFVFCSVPKQRPWVIACTNFDAITPSSVPVFNFTDPHFEMVDGPYVDPFLGASQTGNSRGMLSDGTDHPVFSILDGAYSFVSTDLNRPIRLWSQPPAWDVLTNYPQGSFVTYQGAFWRSVVDSTYNTGVPPGSVTNPPATSNAVPTQAWILQPDGGIWAYGYITFVSNPSVVEIVLLNGLLPTDDNGFIIDTWQLGLYTNTGAVWPTCGAFHEGRIWLGGAVHNRVDGSVANSLGKFDITGIYAPMFSPTDSLGNVLDDSGIGYPINLQYISTALWMEPDHSGGLLIGTASAELLLRASTLNDPITPTSISIHATSRYKSNSVEPVRAGLSLIFVQSFGRRLMEYVVDVFSQKYIARHINEYAKDLTTTGIKKIAYQEELAPTVWVVTNDGTLLSCTYRRVSTFGTEPPVFTAWSRHTSGVPRTVQWICNGTQDNGKSDVLVMLTKGTGGDCYIETMRPMVEAGSPQWQYWHVDSGVTGGQLTANDHATSTLTIGGLGLNQAGIAVYLCGQYCGTYTANASGEVLVPYQSDPGRLVTPAYVASFNSSTAYGFAGISATLSGTTYTVPCVIGYNFPSTLTTLRPQTVEQARTVTGPGIAKTRRLHMYGIQFAGSVTGPIVSVDGGPTAPAVIVGADQITPIAYNDLYNGIFWDTIDSDYTFDGQITITQSTPYPLTIAAITGFLHTQDR